jgi:thiamine biosynthesis lipoprotein
MTRGGIGRRRFLRISASALAAAPLSAGPARARRFTWRGEALGADARLVLHHDDARAAETTVAACVAEIHRLEREFSLYDPDSALATLNRTGRLPAPSLDMRRLAGSARAWGARTGGAFDVTVQALWSLHARRFGETGAPPAAAEIEAARALVDYRAIAVSPAAITVPPGVSVTLNGIAQGYVTDRVAGVLARRGCTRVLVDIGEIRALDAPPGRASWRIALGSGARVPGEADSDVDLVHGAIATSAGSGTPFDASGRHHHLFDPATGRSANAWAQVTVRAADAETADALSTALFVMAPDAGLALAAGLPGCTAWFRDRNGAVRRITGAA